MKDKIIAACIIAVGLLGAGYLVYCGICKISDNSRVVNVRGLAEMEVKSNQVTWPLVIKELGGNLEVIYKNIAEKNEAIRAFLLRNGIKESEMTTSGLEVIDMQAERYLTAQAPYRYNVTSVITVTSSNIDLVKKLLEEQGELLKQGVVICAGDYRYNITYEYNKLNDIKPQMIEEATKNARTTAEKFAQDSHSKLGKIKSANQGLFSIEPRDQNTPSIKRIRVVTSVSYFLED